MSLDLSNVWFNRFWSGKRCYITEDRNPHVFARMGSRAWAFMMHGNGKSFISYSCKRFKWTDYPNNKHNASLGCFQIACFIF